MELSMVVTEEGIHACYASFLSMFHMQFISLAQFALKHIEATGINSHWKSDILG